MSCVQHKRRAAQREKRANEARRRNRARRATTGVGMRTDDDSDTPPPRIKRGHPPKDDTLAKRLAKRRGVRHEIIPLTDEVECAIEMDKDEDEEAEEDESEEEEQDEE